MNTLVNTYLNSDEISLVNKYRADQISRQKCKLEKKKLSHFNIPSLKSLIGSNPVVPDQLYLIKFRHYVSLYLYMHLLSISKPIGVECPYSNLMPVNISRIAAKVNCSRNTLRSAYNELLALGLIMEIGEFIGNKPRMCSVVNYEFIAGFDTQNRKVVFNMQKSTI